MRILIAILILASPAISYGESPKQPPVVGLWEGALKPGAIEIRLGFHVTVKADGSLSATMNSVDQGAKDVPIESVTFKDKKLTLDLTKSKATFEGTLSDDGQSINGDWKQSGLSLPLELKRVEKFTESKRPQFPKKPYPYLEEEVVVENKIAGLKLVGTLTKPKGDGPFRVAILITGSGPQDRDESLLGHKPFLVLADHLTRQGIAVLRCDDRGVGKSTGDHAKATSADFATDVLAQVAYLKERKDIDPKAIGLIGHSEGGLIAPMVAANNADIAFIVMLAGPGFPGDELLLMQGQALLKAMKADDKTLVAQRALQVKLFKLVRERADANAIRAAFEEALKDAPEVVKSRGGGVDAMLKQAEQLTAPWMKFFLAYDPRNDLKKVRCPVLAVNGEKDLQVPAKENLDEIEKTLKDAGNKNVTVREFANLNHLFQNSKTGLPDEYGKIEETFAPAALEAISDWLRKLK